MFLTDVEIEKRIMLAIEKDQSFRSCSTMSTGAHSSGEGELSSSVEGGSPKAMMQALIRDLSFWDAIPPIQVVPQPLPQTNQSSKRRSSSIQPERTSSSSSRQRKDYYRSVSREERNSTRSSSDATIENHYANNGSAGWGRSQPAWKSAVDPMTGRTYWYDAVTRRTQWDKVRKNWGIHALITLHYVAQKRIN